MAVSVTVVKVISEIGERVCSLPLWGVCPKEVLRDGPQISPRMAVVVLNIILIE